jgi:hypothetical protein
MRGDIDMIMASLFDAIGQKTFVVSETLKAANLVKLSGNFLIAVVIESATHSSKVTGFVGEPSYVMTELLAAYVADKLDGKGEVAMLSGPGGLDLTKLRVDGFYSCRSRAGQSPGQPLTSESQSSRTATRAHAHSRAVLRQPN